MMFVRLRRTFVLLATLCVAVCLLPSSANAAVGRHRAKRAHACEAPCLSSKWHSNLSSPRSTHRHPSDDVVVDDFEDRDTGTDPTSTVVADDYATSSSDSTITLPRVRARRTAAPPAARLIVWRNLAAPRPPPSL